MAKKTTKQDKDAASLASQLVSINDRAALLEIERLTSLEKAMKGDNPLDILRANDEIRKMKGMSSAEGQKSYTFDPFALHNSFGFKDTMSAVSFGNLRAMARTPLIRSVIDTRQDQVANFCKPNADDGSIGWTLRKKRGLFDDGKSSELTSADKKEIERLVKFIESCGADTGNVYDKFKRESFETWLRLMVRDSLTLDQAVSEMIENRRGELIQFVSTDSATFRYADETSYYDKDGIARKDVEKFGQIPMYAQIYNQRVVADFYSWELMFGIRNKVTDIKNNGYGISELEDLIKIVTWMLFGDSYNGKFFTQGSSPKGILKVAGNVNSDRLSEFRTYWRQMVAGVENAWRTPVLEADKVEWVDLQKSNQDMQFSQWQEYLIRILCAVFKIDPTEMGFMMAGMGGGQNPYSSHKQRTDYSKDKGLVPLLRHMQTLVNRYIVDRLTDKYEFVFTGIDVEDEKEAADLDEKRGRTWETINEIRKRKGAKPIEGGDIIANSVFMQGQQMAAMGGQQSNEWVDDETGDEDGNYYKENPFDMDEADQPDDGDFNKAFEDINSWIAAGMPNTLKKI